MADKHYHHGGLEQDLIEKGLQLLAREGYDGFSMRKLAALCGVSHAAPYKHFKSKEEIVFAVSARISADFTAALKSAAELHPEGSRERIAAICRGYVEFLSANPDYFRFVFMTAHGRPIPLGESGVNPAIVGAPMAYALACAEAYYRPISGEGWFRQFLCMWSMIHGLTLMLVSQTVAPAGGGAAMAGSMIDTYLDQAGKPAPAQN